MKNENTVKEENKQSSVNNEKMKDNKKNSENGDNQQKGGEKNNEKIDMKKHMQLMISIGRQHIYLTQNLAVLEKFESRIVSEIARIQKEKGLRAPRWSYSKTLLMFMSLKELQSVNFIFSEYKRKKISESVFLAQIVETFLRMMYSTPPSLEVALTEYPVGIMISGLKKTIPDEQYQKLERLMMKHLTDHPDDDEMLRELQPELSLFYSMDPSVAQDLMKDIISEDPNDGSTVGKKARAPEERVLGVSDEYLKGLDTTELMEEFDIEDVIGMLSDTVNGEGSESDADSEGEM